MNKHNLTRILCCLVLITFFSACQSGRYGATEGGALGGGLVGGGLGAIIGNQTGNTGAGIAIGTAAGALTGALVGDQIDKQNDQIAQRDEELAEQERIIEENRRMIEELKRRGAEVRSTNRGVVVNLPDVLFEFDSAKLKGEALGSTAEIADVVKEYPDRKIYIEGHTDSEGTMEYNQRLSEDRASSVSNELVGQGVSRRRIRTQGYGESDPISTNRTAEGRSRNRRVEVIIGNS